MKLRFISLGIIAWIFLFSPFAHANIENPVDFALKDASSGETVKLSDHLGKQVIVLHFWKAM